MDRVHKFLRSVDAKLRMHLYAVIANIIAGNLEGLDIKPLKGQKDCFRCRVGDVRILFLQQYGKNIVYDLGFRGQIYKKGR